MVGKKSGKALLREEGLQRTSNNFDTTMWPQVNMINQKNYYTEFLKRDDQILPLRLQQEERRTRMINSAKDKDRALAHGAPHDADMVDQEMDVDEDATIDESSAGFGSQGALGSKVIVIHPGSQNLRIGLASDALPKTVPMVIARQGPRNESEDLEPKPKRIKPNYDEDIDPEEMFGHEYASKYHAMSADLKVRMRANKRKMLPKEKELVIKYNRSAYPDTISQHNDPLHIDWTEVSTRPGDTPGFICGKGALRIPDDSVPRYRLFWPLKSGWYNEQEYSQKKDIFDDITVIIEQALSNQLGLTARKEWSQYSCVFVIPDLYERQYVIQTLDNLMRDFGFNKVCFMQESLAATYGAGYLSACVVDIGAQKTSICCVEEGMCIEDSRVNLKYGGADVTESFIKMMLFDQFPYREINLNRRYDFLLAEELKAKFCTLNEVDVTNQLFDFHLRASGQDTRKYIFKTYDEVLLAPQGFFRPDVFDNAPKMKGRRSLISPSTDLYDGKPNDPMSAAQAYILEKLAPQGPNVASRSNGEQKAEEDGDATPSRQMAQSTIQRLSLNPERMSSPVAGTPMAEDEEVAGVEEMQEDTQRSREVSVRDDILPIIPLDEAILTSIFHATKGDERRTRDFLGEIMAVGGGTQITGFSSFLEERLKLLRPGYTKDIMIGIPPRELDSQVATWKGASVFGRLSTNDSWIGQLEYDRLGARLLNYKCMWPW